MSKTIAYDPLTRTVVGSFLGEATMTRPSNTTAYQAGDEISNDVDAGDASYWTFPKMSHVPGGRGKIVAARVLSSGPAMTAGIRLGLWDASPTLGGDNLAFPFAIADFDNFQTMIYLSSAQLASATNSLHVTESLTSLPYPLLNPYKCAEGSTTLYGCLMAGAAITPISAQTFQIRLVIQEQ